MSMRRRIPPEKVRTCLFAASASPNALSSSEARLRASRQVMPSSRLTSTKFSCPVRSSSTEAYWPVRLIFRRTAAASRATSSPSTEARPLLGLSKVVSTRMAVSHADIRAVNLNLLAAFDAKSI